VSGYRWHYAPTPIGIPSALLDAFERLKAEAMVVGGSAVQVWVGKSGGIFASGDLDFITHLTVKDLLQAGIRLKAASGRHAVVDGISIEFPTGPLAVAISQSGQMDWHGAWINQVARKAQLGKLWRHLKGDLASGTPGTAGLDKAMTLGWG